MRVIFKSAGIFLIAFLTGAAFYYLLSTKEPTVQSESTINKQPALSNFPTEKSVNEVEPEKNEAETELKVFNVENVLGDEEKSNRDFMETGGVSNIEDFQVKTGETWFGLFTENEKENLRPTKLRIRLNEDQGIIWKNISVKEKVKPLFLINKKKLKKGEVKTLFRGATFEEADETYDEMTPMNDGFGKKFKLNNVEYNLRVEKGVSTEQEKVLVLILETGKESQIIHYINYAGEGDYVGNLFWVGDLDRDGKLDLFMDFWNYEKGYYTSGVFLSSEAEKGKLVKKSTYLMYGGC